MTLTLSFALSVGVAVHSATRDTIAGAFLSAFSVVSTPGSAASAAKHDETLMIKGSFALSEGVTIYSALPLPTLMFPTPAGGHTTNECGFPQSTRNVFHLRTIWLPDDFADGGGTTVPPSGGLVGL